VVLRFISSSYRFSAPSHAARVHQDFRTHSRGCHAEAAGRKLTYTLCGSN